MATIADIGELDLIQRLAEALPPRGPNVLKGLGDDCAVINAGSEPLLLTTDQMVEGVHFILKRTEPGRLAKKLLAVNLSDIAAMGGRPVCALLDAALPKDTDLSFWDDFSHALAEELKFRRLDLVGGDTSSSPGPLVLTMTLLGRGESNRIIYRSGAQAGDSLFISRPIGDSAAGLSLLERPDLDLDSADRAYLLDSHEIPMAEEELGPFLASSGLVTAMIDLSDGLGTDLAHLAGACGLGAEIDAEALPMSRPARRLARLLDLDPLDWAIGGGEDYALLFTTPPSTADRLAALVRQGLNRGIFTVGRMISEPGLRRKSAGGFKPLDRRGYEHFRTPST
ncbi:MAG: thiamine-phosphate kinase [Thermodesulfobacteriota bacterium]|nr:thiamine-phosphate kinase [Thermodesulfobacteriota bacterium]